MIEKIEKQLQSTYRERIDKFNRDLSSAPDHFDVPKVGPG